MITSWIFMLLLRFCFASTTSPANWKRKRKLLFSLEWCRRPSYITSIHLKDDLNRQLETQFNAAWFDLAQPNGEALIVYSPTHWITVDLYSCVLFPVLPLSRLHLNHIIMSRQGGPSSRRLRQPFSFPWPCFCMGLLEAMVMMNPLH